MKINIPFNKMFKDLLILSYRPLQVDVIKGIVQQNYIMMYNVHVDNFGNYTIITSNSNKHIYIHSIYQLNQPLKGIQPQKVHHTSIYPVHLIKLKSVSYNLFFISVPI